jgi:hypothetical protein
MDFNSILVSVGLGKAKEQKIQFFLHDDDTVEFRRLEVDFTVLIERVNDRVRAAFKHFYKLEYDFEGYKNLPAGKVSLGFPRDVVCDLFNTLDESKDNIQKGVNLDRKWITDISKNAFYKAKLQAAPSFFMDKFTSICIVIAVAEAIGIVVKAVT